MRAFFRPVPPIVMVLGDVGPRHIDGAEVPDSGKDEEYAAAQRTPRDLVEAPQIGHDFG